MLRKVVLPAMVSEPALFYLQHAAEHLSAAVVGDAVRGAAGVAADTGAGAVSQVLHQRVDLVRLHGALEGDEVGREAGDVGRSCGVCEYDCSLSSRRGRSSSIRTHAGAAQDGRVSVGLDADAEDVDAGGEDVDGAAKVGKLGLGVVVGVNGTDGDGRLGRGGRGVVRILLLQVSIRGYVCGWRFDLRSRYRRQRREQRQPWREPGWRG